MDVYGKHHHTTFSLSGVLVQNQFLNLCGDMATLHGNDLVTNLPKLK
jgi:hypothetical protein